MFKKINMDIVNKKLIPSKHFVEILQKRKYLFLGHKDGK